MKAAVLLGKQQVSVMDFPQPEMDENSVQVAVRYCGLCGTDFHKYEGKGGSRPMKLPVPLGHEASGVVTAVGSKVLDFRVGDRVTVDPNWSCGHCWYCQQGQRHLCLNSRGVVKGMAEYICPPQENVYHVPDSLSLKDAALAEPLSCCLHGMDKLSLQLGQTVVVIGMGAIGSIMVQLCRQASAGHIVVIETSEAKREMALQLGATTFINPTTENVSKALHAAGIVSVERVLECVGFPSTVEMALEVASPGAVVVLFGLGDDSKPVTMNHASFIKKDLDLRASFLNPCTTRRALEILAGGQLNVDAMISKVIDLEDLPQELDERTWSRKGKVIVKVSEEE